MKKEEIRSTCGEFIQGLREEPCCSACPACKCHPTESKCEHGFPIKDSITTDAPVCGQCLEGFLSSSNWEKEFNKIQEKTKFIEYTEKRFCCGGDYCEGDHLGFIKSFIRTQISKAQRELKENLVKRVEGMRMRCNGENGCGYQGRPRYQEINGFKVMTDALCGSPFLGKHIEIRYYNQAIEDVVKKINK